MYLSQVDLECNFTSTDNDLLRFRPQITNTKNRPSAHMLHDNGASENFVDAKFLAEQLNRPQIHDRGWITVTTAGQKSERLKRQQVWLEMRIPTTDSRYHNIKDWFTIFEMENRFDLVLGKSWMSKKENIHQVDHVGNTLKFLERDWTNLNPQVLPGYTLTTV